MEISFSEDIFPLLCSLLFIGIFAFILIKQYRYKSKAKKLKYEGTGAIKKTKVSAVREKYIHEKGGSYYLYWLESKDESGNTYKSERFKNAEHGGRTSEEMKVIYDGVVYDLGDKDNAVKQVSDNINRLEMELQSNPGFFRKISLKQDLKTMKNYLEIANEGPITPYLIINGHKISVGDSVDVFVNPDKPSQYYFDLDFMKEN